MKLYEEITEKDRLNYIKTQIWRILYCPSSYQDLQHALFWVEQIYNNKIKKIYVNKIWEWFYGKLEIEDEKIEEYAK